MVGVEALGIENHEKIVETARRRDAKAMRAVMLEHSKHHLDQMKIMSKEYPQFFQMK